MWVHLNDPTEEQLAQAFSLPLHDVAHEVLARVRDFDEDVFSNIDAHDGYLVGEIALPVEDDSPDQIGTVGVRILANFDTLVTVIRTPRAIPTGYSVPDLGGVVALAQEKQFSVGNSIWALIDHVTDEVHRQLDEAVDGAAALESALDSEDDPPEGARRLISDLRHTFLAIRAIAQPLLDLTTEIIDDRLDLRRVGPEAEEELFPRETEIRVIDSRAKLRHAIARVDHGLQIMSTLSDNLKEFLAREQADAGNRMAAIASIMLLPTFVVGLYGMNIDPDSFPEMGFLNGYLFAWILIAGLTAAQIAFFRRRRWL
jgi:Mg2+ and Co2+ transporter CorA